MLASLALLGVKDITLSFGNTAIFNGLCEYAELNDKNIATLRDIFRRKSVPDLTDFFSNNEVNHADKFRSLISLDGEQGVLDQALKLFEEFPEIISAITNLERLHESFKDSNLNLMFDLGEVKAYEYHNGLVFAAYHSSFSKALAQGGRYNSLSESFGSPRDATGFSFDLKFLIQQQLNS